MVNKGFFGIKFPEGFDHIETITDDDAVMVYSAAAGKPVKMLLSDFPSGIGLDNYYTKTNLQTAGQAQVHYDNLTSKPSTYAPPLASSTVRGGVKIGYSATGANLPLLLSSEKAYIALSSAAIVAALAFTPYSDDNPAGYISDITKAMVENVLTGNITSHTHSYVATEVDPVFTAWRDASRTAKHAFMAPSAGGAPTWRQIDYSDLANTPTIPTGFTLSSDLLSGGTNSLNAYSNNQAAQRRFYTTTDTPTGTSRLNIGAYFYATRLYEGANRVVTGTPWTAVGYLIASNNLSDVASPSTARDNLGLKSAATKDTGTIEGTIPILGTGGKLSTSVLPELAISDTYVVSSQAAQLALVVQKGDLAVRSDLSKSYINATGNNASMSDWVELLSPPNAVSSVFGRTGAVVATSGDYTTTLVTEGTNLYFTDDRAQAAITGGASTIVTSNLTASRALVSNSSGKVAVSAVTSTELGYLAGVSSTIQNQLNGKQPSLDSSTSVILSSNTLQRAALSGDVSAAQNVNSVEVTGIRSKSITLATGYLRYTGSAWEFKNETYLTGITSGMVTTALGYTPYNATNPNGYTSNTGTVTSVAMSVPTGFSVGGTPITTNGTLALSFATGYSLPTTAKQSNWDSAYSFTNGYATNYPDLVAIEALTGTSGLLKKTAANTWALDTNTYLTSYTETDPVFVAWRDASRTAKTVYAAPTAAVGTPTWRQLAYADISGLGDAATKAVGTSSGNVMEVGAFGLGQTGITITGITPFNDLAGKSTGFYRFSGTGGIDSPLGDGVTQYFSILHQSWGSEISTNQQSSQLAIHATQGNRIFIRTKGNTGQGGAWNSWREFFHTGNLVNPVTGTGTAGQISFWNDTGNSQAGSANLVWDNANGILSSSKIAIGKTSVTTNHTLDVLGDIIIGGKPGSSQANTLTINRLASTDSLNIRFTEGTTSKAGIGLREGTEGLSFSIGGLIAGNVAMYIDTNKAVAINKTSVISGYMLDVNGAIIASGNIRGASYLVGATTVIDTNRHAAFANLTASGTTTLNTSFNGILKAASGEVSTGASIKDLSDVRADITFSTGDLLFYNGTLEKFTRLAAGCGLAKNRVLHTGGSGCAPYWDIPTKGYEGETSSTSETFTRTIDKGMTYRFVTENKAAYVFNLVGNSDETAYESKILLANISETLVSIKFRVNNTDVPLNRYVGITPQIGTIYVEANKEYLIKVTKYGVALSEEDVVVEISELYGAASNNYLEISPSNLFLLQPNGSNGLLSVYANVAWGLTGLPTWLSANKTSGTGTDTVTITATSANTSTDTRSAELTFTKSGGGITRKVTIYQIGTSTQTFIEGEAGAGGDLSCYVNQVGSSCFEQSKGGGIMDCMDIYSEPMDSAVC